MCRPSSDEQIRGIDKESRATAQEADEMFTNQSVKAEVAYRRERLARDYGRSTRRTGAARRHLVHLFTKNV
jgi:energy-coupling factor transporter ATP-binding protein EcfA2